MAHPDIELMNTTYQAVPAVNLPKVGGGLARFIDEGSIDFAYGSYTKLSSSKALTKTASKVDLNTFVGNNCTSSSHGIKINRAGIYMVWASAYLTTGYAALDRVHIQVLQNSTVVCEGMIEMPEASSYITCPVSPIIVTASVNDVFYMYAYNQTNARGSVGTKEGCGLFVVQIN